jgi:hypothetical protein
MSELATAIWFAQGPFASPQGARAKLRNYASLWLVLFVARVENQIAQKRGRGGVSGPVAPATITKLLEKAVGREFQDAFWDSTHEWPTSMKRLLAVPYVF